MEIRSPNPDTVFVLFGAGGDLSRRLIVPALFNLHLDGQLPARFRLLAVDRQDNQAATLAQSYRQGVADFSRRGAPAADVWTEFATRIDYQRMDVTDPAAFTALGQRLSAKAVPATDRIFYMATPPSLFAPIARGLGAAGLARDPACSRIVVEKPLGHDLRSFREINAVLGEQFTEKQLYRIDHFLGKETVQNILAMRFANPIFEPVWDRRYIDHVVVTVAETLGVEHRGAFYERAGALRDMVQNHLMQLLCLVAMEPPVAYDADNIRGRKLDVLSALRPITREQVPQCAVRGQYADGWINGARVPAYRHEPEVNPQSNTETYAAVRLFVDNWRWQDVPFYLRTGKRLTAAVWEISIRFRDVPHRAFPASAGLNTQPVRLVIQMQPEQGIVLKFMAKEPGSALRLRPVDMRFSYREAFNMPSPEAYETLLHDVMTGDATLFMRADQVEAAWRVLMPVLEAWADNPPDDFPNYAAGTWGPESAEALVAADGNSWLTPTLPPEAPAG
ncbi:glucose-6-phosphate dehydrogenase [Sulfuricaulis limicola]|uniref:Glucose-6-phosphate 1-dehydrogenase n=1 Tax=Sulfuricaulis limicola TaxID=1620215 RepID=A0A1B4XJM8_9GAMM|nr:glucose-6-phosphate dehydrogenase [Sulfuricaulis limicola]BAV35012.1 glucose-6-phosphate dehydrogenase [Sulfuricaulis limicola]